jgi:lysozyme
MTITSVLRDQLIAHEGLRLKPYHDTVGKLTIGVGRNLTDVGISQEEALYLLDNDLRASIADLERLPWFESLDPIRQRVVVDMRFNLGPSKFRGFHNTIAAMTVGDYERASRLMLRSKWAEQVGGRAARLARMMQTGHDEGTP